MRFACSETPFFANHNGSSAETNFTNNFYAAFTRRFACRANTGPANHNGTSAQTHFANILLAAFTMRLRTGKNQYYGNHNGSSAQTQCAHILGAAITMRFAACHNHCFANHNGSNAQNRRGPSGDNARRSPFWRLWVLRLPLQRARGAQRRQPAPQALLEALGTAPATAESEGGPAATTRAANILLAAFTMRLRTGKNQYYGNHNGSSAQTQCAHILAAAITMRFAACHNHCVANHNGSNAQNRRGPSGDNARRSPFWRLWVLRLPLQRARGAQRRQRAPQPLSGGSGYCACHCRERGGPSGDNGLWLLRLPLQRARGAQRRQRAPQPLLEALGTAPATAESEGGPAATTRAAAPPGGSGYCACHCRERGGPSGDNARRSPFCSLWMTGSGSVSE